MGEHGEYGELVRGSIVTGISNTDLQAKCEHLQQAALALYRSAANTGLAEDVARLDGLNERYHALSQETTIQTLRRTLWLPVVVVGVVVLFATFPDWVPDPGNIIASLLPGGELANLPPALYVLIAVGMFVFALWRGVEQNALLRYRARLGRLHASIFALKQTPLRYIVRDAFGVGQACLQIPSIVADIENELSAAAHERVRSYPADISETIARLVSPNIAATPTRPDSDFAITATMWQQQQKYADLEKLVSDLTVTEGLVLATANEHAQTVSKLRSQFAELVAALDARFAADAQIANAQINSRLALQRSYLSSLTADEEWSLSEFLECEHGACEVISAHFSGRMFGEMNIDLLKGLQQGQLLRNTHHFYDTLVEPVYDAIRKLGRATQRRFINAGAPWMFGMRVVTPLLVMIALLGAGYILLTHPELLTMLRSWREQHLPPASG